MIEITRFQETVTVTAASSAATSSPRFSFQHMAGAGVLIGNTGGATQIAWYGASGHETTPLQIFSDGSAVTTAVTVGAHPVPDACFSFPYVVPVIAGGTSCQMTVVAKG
jgi:hypothetical protein